MYGFTCYSFEQEPFKSLPLIWTIHERSLAIRSRKYISSGQIDILNDWKRVFNRSTVVVFPNYVLPVIFNRKFVSCRHSSASYTYNSSQMIHMEWVPYCIQLKAPLCKHHSWHLYSLYFSFFII